MERIPDVSQRIAAPGDGVAVEEAPGGRLVLRRRRFGAARGAIVGLFGASRDFTVRLDPLGSAAWRLVDGTRTVGAIRTELQRAFPDEPEVAARLGKFVGTLLSHQMIRLE